MSRDTVALFEGAGRVPERLGYEPATGRRDDQARDGRTWDTVVYELRRHPAPPPETSVR